MTITRYQSSDGFSELSWNDYKKDREEFPLLLRILLTPDYEIKKLIKRKVKRRTIYDPRLAGHPY